MKRTHGIRRAEASALGAPGFLLLNSELKPMFVNDEAVQILSYPNYEKSPQGVGKLLDGLVSSVWSTPPTGRETASIVRIKSGRRHYTCRVFAISPVSRSSQQPTMALLIERNPMSTDLLEMAEGFNLTQREHQAVQYLALGLTSKEIAERMGISANTVKAFLRLVMIKTGVTTRSGIIGKLLKTA
jgi:DNA-binding CsgD family transcriptional regulator